MNHSPFKFLDSYQKEDIKHYFGREKETKNLFKKVFESNLVLLYGLSGTGKTSLINCGLANMFADTDWLPLYVRRTSNILENLQEAIYEAAYEKEELDGKPIRLQLKSLYLDYYKPVFLIFDQFEELFILGNKEETDRFFWMLAELLKAGLQIKIILIMREEYLGNLDHYERIIPHLFDKRFRVERMRLEDIHDVINKSAKAFDIEMPNLPTDLNKQIIENIRSGKNYVDLANLQVYLDRLYRDDVKRKGQEDRPVRFDQELLERTGELDDVLARFLDEQLAIINRGLVQKGVKVDDLPLKILAQLITNDETKQPRSLGSIMESFSQNEKVSEEDITYCIKELEDLRIIRYLEKA